MGADKHPLGANKKANKLTGRTAFVNLLTYQLYTL